jgi:lauroyl/myristoyl acyltransferase
MAHTGCWQVALSALGYLKTRVNMVIRREEGDIDRHYFEHQSNDTPFNIIDPEGYLGGTIEMINALKNGEIVSIMGDRIFGSLKNRVPVDFLGEKALFPSAHSRLPRQQALP